MTTKQLEALLIDESLGELSEEASALLEAWLERFPESRAEAEEIRRAVGLAEAAVVSRPLDLKMPDLIAFPSAKPRFPGLLRLAAGIALLGLAVGAGFLAGKGSGDSEAPRGVVAASEVKNAPSPWARYQVDDKGRLAVILPHQPKS
jgi:anti-sigma factor RsiW